MLFIFSIVLRPPLSLLIVVGLARLPNFIRVKPEYRGSLNQPPLMSPLLLSLQFLLIQTEKVLGHVLLSQDAGGVTTCKG